MLELRYRIGDSGICHRLPRMTPNDQSSDIGKVRECLNDATGDNRLLGIPP